MAGLHWQQQQAELGHCITHKVTSQRVPPSGEQLI
eukprot:XP_001709796.1 Hypothetical protein GL50803_98312 [Giardia lamblia ATCC 50803]